MNDDEYYNFKTGGGEVSRTLCVAHEDYMDFEVVMTRHCLICGNDLTADSGFVCPDCREAVSWAKKKMKEETK